MRVLIAGGGTGGLAAAIALRKAGLEPLVLEQAPAFTAIGAGNAPAALREYQYRRQARTRRMRLPPGGR